MGSFYYLFICFLYGHLSNFFDKFESVKLKGALLGLRQFSANESPVKMMKNAFYFTLKALFVLKLFKFLSWLSGHV